MEHAWWASSPLDWTRQEPVKVQAILKSAYPTVEALSALAIKAGLPSREANGANTGEDVWKWAINTAVAGGWLILLYEAVISDPNTQPYHAMLYKWLYPNGGPGLQTINVAAIGFINPEMEEQVSRDSRRRTAMIEIGGRAAGTGFLVGPDLLLTAAHVIDALKFPPSPGGNVVAVFDFLPQIARSPAETGVRAGVLDVGLVGSLPSQDEVKSNARDFYATDEYLDFLLIRLDRDMSSDATNGPRRGFYELYNDEYAFKNAKLLRITQHPLGQTQLVSQAIGPFEINPQKTRVRYTTNTLPGSSGSAVLDTNGRLVALHHYAGDGYNQGVLINRIAGLIETKALPLPRLPAAAPMPLSAGDGAAPLPDSEPMGPDPFETLGFGNEPFAGRSDLRKKIKRMLNHNDRRILVIEGGADSGKTFSHRFLTHLEARKDEPDLRKRVKYSLRIANINLDQFVNVPRKELLEKIVTRISKALGLTWEPTQAQPARRVADLVDLLAPMRIDSGVASWIFFDSLNRHNLEHGHVKELIASLLQLVRENEASPIRLVISSRPPVPLAQELIQWAERDQPEGLSRDEVEQWLNESAKGKGQPLDEVKLTAKLNELFPPGVYPSPRSLAPSLPKSLDELMKGVA